MMSVNKIAIYGIYINMNMITLNFDDYDIDNDNDYNDYDKIHKNNY